MPFAPLGRLRRLWPCLLPPTAVALANLFAAPPNSLPSGQTRPAFPIAFYSLGTETDRPQFAARGPDFSASLYADRIELARGEAAITIRLIGGEVRGALEGRDPLPWAVNHFVGRNPDQWRTRTVVFRTVSFPEVWPGISMTYGASGRFLKSEFVVSPGADPSRIALRYEGALSLEVIADGSLLVHTASGVLREAPPVLYQRLAGAAVPVAGRFRRLGASDVGFEVDRYDASRSLWIDPEVTFSTYYGGARTDQATAVATDPAGNIYLAGWTESRALFGRAMSPFLGTVDAFVVKFDPTGQVPLYLTYLGGVGDDRALTIDVDGEWGVWIAGYTTSADFPVAGAGQYQRRGLRDAFFARLNQSGSILTHSSYLGGSGLENATGIRADPAGGAWLAGDTTSPDFPVANAYQRGFQGNRDAFLVKLAADGSQTTGTFVGGSGDDRATSLVWTAAGPVVSGCTQSAGFPVSSAAQGSLGGGQDGFVTAFDPSGASLRFSTFVGGSASDCVSAIATDTLGNVYAAGSTASTNLTASAGFQGSSGGSTDAFLLKLGPAGARQWLTYLGGKGADYAAAAAVDGSQRPWVAGYTASANFPVLRPTQTTHGGGGYDAFVTRLESSGQALSFSTYLGGAGSDSAAAVAVTATGDAIVAGATGSTGFPTRSPFQAASRGGIEAFLTRFSGQ